MHRSTPHNNPLLCLLLTSILLWKSLDSSGVVRQQNTHIPQEPQPPPARPQLPLPTSLARNTSPARPQPHSTGSNLRAIRAFLSFVIRNRDTLDATCDEYVSCVADVPERTSKGRRRRERSANGTCGERDGKEGMMARATVSAGSIMLNTQCEG